MFQFSSIKYNKIMEYDVSPDKVLCIKDLSKYFILVCALYKFILN